MIRQIILAPLYGFNNNAMASDGLDNGELRTKCILGYGVRAEEDVRDLVRYPSVLFRGCSGSRVSHNALCMSDIKAEQTPKYCRVSCRLIYC